MSKLENFIEENKKRQVKVYSDIIRKIVENDPKYYKDKDYAKYFKER